MTGTAKNIRTLISVYEQSGPKVTIKSKEFEVVLGLRGSKCTKFEQNLNNLVTYILNL